MVLQQCKNWELKMSILLGNISVSCYSSMWSVSVWSRRGEDAEVRMGFETFVELSCWTRNPMQGAHHPPIRSLTWLYRHWPGTYQRQTANEDFQRWGRIGWTVVVDTRTTRLRLSSLSPRPIFHSSPVDGQGGTRISDVDIVLRARVRSYWLVVILTGNNTMLSERNW